jgi:hypothetical protein
VPGDHDDDAAEPTPVSPEDWRETERWLDEWTRRSTDDEALVGGGPAPASSASTAPPAAGGADAPANPSEGNPPPDAPAFEAAALDPLTAQAPAQGSALPPGYAPPASPAYAAGGKAAPPPLPRPARPRPQPAAPVPVPPPPDADLRSVPLTRNRLRARRLLAAGVAALAVALAAAAVLAIGDGDDDEVVSLGEVRTADTGATVRSGSRTSPLQVESTIGVGDVVRAPADGAVAIALDGGGAVRFDSGASVTFIDDAINPETGEREGDSLPVLEILSGRVWVNPPDSTVVDVLLPGGRVTSAANPMAIECPGDCNVQAPGGGVDIDADSGADAAPSPSEIVDLRPDGTMALRVAAPVTEWSRQNLDADAQDGLGDPEPAETPGVVASAVIDGVYPLNINVVGEPQGDALPDALRYGAGETYALDIVTDGSACPPSSCQAPISATGGATGTADVGGGSVTVTFTQPINCYDESRQNVVVEGIGTTTVSATLSVSTVALDDTRWRIATASGGGTVTTTLTTPCNPGDVLGTSTSPTSVTLG